MISPIEVESISRRAYDMRMSVIDMLLAAGSGHTAGPLGMAEVFATLYFHSLKHDPKNPGWVHRDRVILSNGHICPILYAAMAHSGYFPITELKTLRKFGSRLQGHPHKEYLEGIETSSGPLGSGLSQAIGMAIVDRYIKIKPDRYFYTILGDGEMNEGQIWESIMLLNKEKLHKIITIIDRNTIQIDGNTEDVMPLESLSDKLRSFNLNVIEIDGHNVEAISNAIDEAKSVLHKATVIIAHTIPGKGVVEFEGDYHWHGKSPNKEEAKEAIKELRTLKGKINYD